MKHFAFTLLCLFSLGLKAQEKNNLFSINFGYGLNQFSMKSLNEDYIKRFASQTYSPIIEDEITFGQQFSAGIHYQPIRLFDIGFYGNYQSGKSENNSEVYLTNVEGTFYEAHKTKNLLKTQAYGVGLSGTFYISQLLKLQEMESNFLKSFHTCVEIAGGIGFSKATLSSEAKTLSLANYSYSFTSKDFQGQLGLKFEYDFIKKPIISSVGLRAGYQLFETKTVRNEQDEEWKVYGTYPINLNFSGMYGGIYLKFGI